MDKKTAKLVATIVEGIDDKKGSAIASLDLSAIDGAITSAFVVCTADSTTQVAAIANGVEEKTLAKLKEKPWRVEGLQNAIWVIMDYGDVMVHIFQTEARAFYKLEALWADAPATHYSPPLL